MHVDSQEYKAFHEITKLAIKDVLVDNNMEYPEGWSGGWLIPSDDEAADNMLDDMAETILKRLFIIEERR